MKCELKDGYITVTLPVNPRPSKSGKTIVVASTNGNIATSATHDGKPIIVGFNAYVSR